MGQEQDSRRNETVLERDRTNDRKKDESATGRNIPGGDGTVGDEQLHALGKDRKAKPTGQDHSTVQHETTDADGGVGTIQDREDTTSDAARIRD